MPPEPGWVDVASTLGISLDAATAQRLETYLQLLQRWNSTFNLTAIRDHQQMRVQHVADSMAILPSVERYLHGRAATVLDVGSGGGLPGVVLAILNPTLRVTCLDAVGKKAAFVRQVQAELALPNLTAVHARAQAYRGAFDLLVSRAFASLVDFTAWTAHLRSPTGVWLAMKGHPSVEELAALPSSVEVFHVEPITVPGLDAQRCAVWMRPRSEPEQTR